MTLNLLADEDVNFNIIKSLRLQGFNITSILEDYRSASDEAVLSISLNTKAILITEDKDFGEWVFAHKVPVIGIMLLRYNPGDLPEIIESVAKVLSFHDSSLYGKFIVVTPKKIRIRDII